MTKVQEILLRLKCNCSDSISEKIKAEFEQLAETLNVTIEILEQRLVFELEEEWKKKKKKSVAKKKASKRWDAVKNALWYNKAKHRYLFEPALQKIVSSKRKALADGWRFLGLIESRPLIKKFKYGVISKEKIFYALKNKKLLKYVTWC